MSRKEVWVDIDTATRAQMAMSFARERQRIARLLTQITIDMDHFNRIHPDEEPLKLVVDFTNDVAERRAVEDVLAEKRMRKIAKGEKPE